MPPADAPITTISRPVTKVFRRFGSGPSIRSDGSRELWVISAAGAKFHKIHDRLYQPFEIDRLGQMRIESRRCGAVAVAVGGESGQCHDQRLMLLAATAAQRLDERIAVLLGHA